MLLVNIDYIPGKEFEVLGLVKGTVVQSKNFGKDFMAGMKTLVGGEITGYTEMLNEARQIAVKRMVDEAERLGAGCFAIVVAYAGSGAGVNQKIQFEVFESPLRQRGEHFSQIGQRSGMGGVERRHPAAVPGGHPNDFAVGVVDHPIGMPGKKPRTLIDHVRGHPDSGFESAVANFPGQEFQAVRKRLVAGQPVAEH